MAHKFRNEMNYVNGVGGIYSAIIIIQFDLQRETNLSTKAKGLCSEVSLPVYHRLHEI